MQNATKRKKCAHWSPIRFVGRVFPSPQLRLVVKCLCLEVNSLTFFIDRESRQLIRISGESVVHPLLSLWHLIEIPSDFELLHNMCFGRMCTTTMFRVFVFYSSFDTVRTTNSHTCHDTKHQKSIQFFFYFFGFWFGFRFVNSVQNVNSKSSTTGHWQPNEQFYFFPIFTLHLHLEQKRNKKKWNKTWWRWATDDTRPREWTCWRDEMVRSNWFSLTAIVHVEPFSRVRCASAFSWFVCDVRAHTSTLVFTRTALQRRDHTRSMLTYGRCECARVSSIESRPRHRSESGRATHVSCREQEEIARNSFDCGRAMTRPRASARARERTQTRSIRVEMKNQTAAERNWNESHVCCAPRACVYVSYSLLNLTSIDDSVQRHAWVATSFFCLGISTCVSERGTWIISSALLLLLLPLVMLLPSVSRDRCTVWFSVRVILNSNICWFEKWKYK